jgi:ribosomal protein L3 glutamine methyltransferase
LTLGELLKETENKFSAARLHYGHGTTNARDEAAFLVLRSLRLPFEADLSRKATRKAVKQVESLARKRINDRIPVAYLLNEAWLDGRAFYVDRRVLVPRSHIAFMLKDFGKPKRVLDLCTGSGCLAILAAQAFPDARVDASDLSEEALKVARTNVARHRLGRRIRLIRSDLFDSIEDRYDLVITNPPYVSTAAMRKLPPEYRYEPGIGLAGGRDGLFLVRKILKEAETYLSAGGRLVCEVGDGRRGLRGRALRWPRDEVLVYEGKRR